MSDRSRTRRGLGRRRRRLLRPPPPSHDTPSTNTNTDQIPHVRQIHPTHLLDGPRCQVPSPPAARFRRTLTAPDTGFGTSSYPPTTTRSHRQQLSCDVK